MKITSSPARDHKFSPAVISFLILTLAGFLFLFLFVKIEPHVDQNFFFSSDDPQFQEENLISHLFVRKDALMVMNARGQIQSDEYVKRIEQLTNRLSKIPGVINVNSLANGPKDVDDALKSPLWKRLLISEDLQSSNLMILIEEIKTKDIVPSIEKVIDEFSSADFQLGVSGQPYIVEQIRRNLVRDLAVFSLLALVIFGFIIFSIVHSRTILIGTMVTCLNACVWTFMLTNLFSIPIGVLTANLGTIVFIMTLSHLVFLTFNWKNACVCRDSHERVKEAISFTFSPSFWCMCTALLGFLSLFFVPAKPLKEFGAAGIIGAIAAMTAAYGMFPTFLRLASLDVPSTREQKWPSKVYQFFEQQKKAILTSIILIALLALPGLKKLNLDPSLLSYFAPKSELAKGLEYIDQNGGGSPLVLVIRSQENNKLITSETYEKLWQLQEALEQHRSVGSVISLPVFVAQAKKAPLAFLLPQNTLLDILSQAEYDEVAKSFITQDRKYGLFFLRMREDGRSESRLKIIEELKGIVESQGFYPELTGGVYALQGHLSKLVASSLVYGLGDLLLAFTVMILIVSRSWKMALSIGLSLGLVPVSLLGLIGLYRIPLDVISAPASNIAIALGIDAMIHMMKAHGRLHDWQKVRDLLWQPVLTSMVVLTAGFMIFLCSAFPPTQRFGAAISFGTILSAFTALYMMPAIFRFFERSRKPPAN